MTIEMEPVWVWEGLGARRRIDDVERAALFLLHSWPEKHMTSRAHLAARKAALAVLEGKKEAPAFRAAFVKAAEEAGVLAPGEEHASMRSPLALPGHRT
jgi:hypothetical protein